MSTSPRIMDSDTPHLWLYRLSGCTSSWINPGQDGELPHARRQSKEPSLNLHGVQIGLILLVFLTVLLMVGRDTRQLWPAVRRRRPSEDVPLVDDVDPYEIPDETSPSRDDD